MAKKKIKNHKEKNIIRLGVPNLDTKLSVDKLSDGFFYKIDVVSTSTKDTSISRKLIHDCDIPKHWVNRLINVWNKEKDRRGRHFTEKKHKWRTKYEKTGTSLVNRELKSW